MKNRTEQTLLLFFLLLVINVIAPAQQSATESTAQSLTPSERRGRTIYFRGESPAKSALTAVLGNIDVPATTLTCAACHGSRGEGKTEGGVASGNLSWSNLTKPSGHTHESGRKHGPFKESTFAAAVLRGVDPTGNNLMVAMPRYRMSIEDMNDLIAYIKRLEFDRDPGVTPESIEVGVPLPTNGALVEVGKAIHQMLSAYFEDVNAQGGIHNRKIKLHVAEYGNDPASSLRAFTNQNEIFAFVSGVSAGVNPQISSFAREDQIPFIGPATLMPPIEHPPNPYIFYLLPGVGEQAAALVNFADRQLELKKPRAAILFATAELPSAAADAAMLRAQQIGWKEIVKIPYSGANFDANKFVQQLKADGISTVFIFGLSNDTQTLIRTASTSGWTPTVFSLGVLVAKTINDDLPSAFTMKVFLAFPTVPTDVSPEGGTEYQLLSEKYKLPPRHPAAQISALAAARTFVEGLRRAGADLSREQLVTALEGLHDYSTGLTPKLIFGPNNRVGAAGSYVVTINAETKQYVTVGGWVPASP